MGSLADNIELYIKQLISEAHRDMIEISRAEVANRFECVPSQINYVLQTRFSPQHGYLVESRRGGGGYIRIVRVSNIPTGREFFGWLFSQIGERCSEENAEALLFLLEKDGIISKKHGAVIRAITKHESDLVEIGMTETIRAALLRATLYVVLSGIAT